MLQHSLLPRQVHKERGPGREGRGKEERVEGWRTQVVYSGTHL